MRIKGDSFLYRNVTIRERSRCSRVFARLANVIDQRARYSLFVFAMACASIDNADTSGTTNCVNYESLRPFLGKFSYNLYYANILCAILCYMVDFFLPEK